jgi:FixJ family two-component response regulator
MERRDLKLPVIFVTGHGDVPSCAQAMKAGALEFLEKPLDDEDLLEAIGRAIARHRLEQAERAQLESVRARLRTLTPREYEVLTHVITGMLNKQIAVKLGTSEKTIKVHRARVMGKMQVESVAEFARLAEEVGLRGPSDAPRAD